MGWKCLNFMTVYHNRTSLTIWLQPRQCCHVIDIIVNETRIALHFKNHPLLVFIDYLPSWVACWRDWKEQNSIRSQIPAFMKHMVTADIITVLQTLISNSLHLLDRWKAIYGQVGVRINLSYFIHIIFIARLMKFVHSSPPHLLRGITADIQWNFEFLRVKCSQRTRFIILSRKFPALNSLGNFSMQFLIWLPCL